MPHRKHGKHCIVIINNSVQAPSTKHFIIPVFIMNAGCPQHCIFCNQKITAGNFPTEISKEMFHREVDAYLRWNRNKTKKAQIAFYGGSFTGIPRAYQEQLLSWANTYMESGQADSIRISTRPDYINPDNLSFLQKYGVTTVEIGAQSFSDPVLSHAKRGHDAAAIKTAMLLLRERGFKAGLHLMAGLPLDTKEGFLDSVNQAISLKPDTVRIHPVMVFGETPLAEIFRQGEYQPLSLSGAVEYCRLAWEKFSEAGIRIIRIGVQLTPEMEKSGAVLAGPLHPALGSLVLSSVFYCAILRLLKDIPRTTRTLRFNLSSRDISNFRGLNNANTTAIKKLYPQADIVVESDNQTKRGKISVLTDQGHFFCVEIPSVNLIPGE